MPVEKRPRLSLIYNENTLFLLYGVVSLEINKTGKKETIQLETHVLGVLCDTALLEQISTEWLFNNKFALPVMRNADDGCSHILFQPIQ